MDGITILVGSKVLIGYWLVVEQLRIGHHLPPVVDYIASLGLLDGCAFSGAALLNHASSVVVRLPLFPSV